MSVVINGTTGITTPSLDNDGGTIDGTVIGGTTKAAGSFTTVSATGVATFSAGSAGAPAITTNGNTNTGILFPAVNEVAFSAAGAERMRVTQALGLLIETTANPSSTNPGIRIVKGGNQVYAAWSFGTHTAYAEYIYWLNGNGTVGSISSSGSSTSYNTSSDYRLKDNVAPITGAISRIALLKPVTYTWKADGSTGEGFIAHELQEVVPSCVSGEKDAVNEDGSIKPQGIDTSFLVATLTAAIQEQQLLIEGLTLRVSALETEVLLLKGAM